MVGGREVCEVCARNEILKRIRRDAISRKIFNYMEKVLVVTPDFQKSEGELLKALLMKACYSCKLEGIQLEVRTGEEKDVTSKLWKLLSTSTLEAKGRGVSKVVLPFTADFLMGYMIYGISKGQMEYMWLLDYSYKVNDLVFITPFFSTSRIELSAYSLQTSVTGDPLFDSITSWEHEALKENYELFHAYWNSGKILREEKHCRLCGAFTHDEVCQRCLQRMISRP